MRFREVGRRMEHIETRVEEKEKKINKSIFPNFFNDLPNEIVGESCDDLPDEISIDSCDDLPDEIGGEY